MKTDLIVEQPIGGGESSASASSGFRPVEATAEKVPAAPRWSNFKIRGHLKLRGKTDCWAHNASERSQGQRDAFRHDFGFGSGVYSGFFGLYDLCQDLPVELFHLGFIVDGDK